MNGHVEVSGKPQQNRDTALHVDGSTSPQLVSTPFTGQVSVDGDRVEVTGDDDSRIAVEVGACDESVAVTGHVEVPTIT